ncbi:glycosyltransferase [Candidatus Woesearchaeota archaeon]|nr:glycosyltransferase [Candidatus Woesearchaeota archaeon]
MLVEDELSQKVSDIKTVVLAEGLGTRLGKRTKKVPKPLIKIKGKPLLEHIINNSKRQGFSNFIIKVAYLSEKIENYFERGKKWNCKIRYINSPEPTGTAGKLNFLKKEKLPVVILYGDVLLNFNIKKMLRFHIEKGASATLAVHTSKHPEDSDVVSLDKSGRIKKMIHKPGNTKYGNITNAGLYILNPECFKNIPNKDLPDFGKTILPELIKKDFKVFGYFSDEYMKDVGTEERLKEAVKHILETLKRNNISGEVIVVDNDSSDRTGEFAKKSGAKVILQKKRGYGNAIRKGFEECNGEYALCMDPDESYDIKTIPLMLKTLKKGYGYVNANRFANMQEGSMHKSHIIGNKIINFLGNFFFRTKGKDMLSGFKGFENKTLKKMNLKAPRWDLNIEIQSKLRKNNIKYTEIPTKYYKRGGESKLSGIRAGWNNLRYMLLYSPRAIFFLPSLILIILSGTGMILSIIGFFGMVAMILFSLLYYLGVQTLLLSNISQLQLHKREKLELKGVIRTIAGKSLEKILAVAGGFFIISVIGFLTIFIKWIHTGVLSPEYVVLGLLFFDIFITGFSLGIYSLIQEQILIGD